MRNLATNEVSELVTDGLFIFIGYDSNVSIVPPEIMDKGQIKVDMQMRTPIKGLFAAGDLRAESRRQIVMACADGATAAMSAYDYLNDLNTCE
jgi:thioredoxin reductase (NADPH)